MALAALISARARLRVPMVRPPRAVTAVPIADIRAQPNERSELVDQSSFGERLTVLGERDGWLWVQGEDHYFGWIDRAAASDLIEGSSALEVAVVLAEVRDEPDATAPPTSFLPAGSPLSAYRRQSDWAQTTLGWLRVRDLVDPADLPRRAPTAADLIATAECFLGTPYLWGGTSAAGIDCSAYVQQVYRLNGVGLDRDADQQALEGRPVERARAGDLFFFGTARVTHVGLALDDGTFVHAPGGGAVERSALGGEHTLLAIRRYLVDEDA